MFPQTKKKPKYIPKPYEQNLDAYLKEIAEAFGCEVLFLPPYSPDLNPIEKKWAWLKRKLRETLQNYSSFDTALHILFQVG